MGGSSGGDDRDGDGGDKDKPWSDLAELTLQMDTKEERQLLHRITKGSLQYMNTYMYIHCEHRSKAPC